MSRSNGDPVGSERPNGKSNAARKGRYDGSYSGTEQHKKDRLMNQFRRTGEGPGAQSEAYRNASVHRTLRLLNAALIHCRLEVPRLAAG